ncbi:protein HEADING DATE 3B-like isoform X2 [Abrus precatorius]|uniref:Protein HEADING DATE 3B-like isoform X2 n=1 Tax=Abrus precatorius TaxID=3816 RepID=A0A8B8JFR1_ABRPR|nr:protein HEADING DATE 3B-like isoform X2 [Abrus precatorius]
MKRGKEEEKGPMFPRLHVNDTEKGGPRAPPRNKMALYEQFSIPSQRFNPNSSSNILSQPPSSTRRKKVDEDDFCVYIQSRAGQSNDKTLESFNKKKFTPLGTRNFCSSVSLQNDADKDPSPTQFGSPLVGMRKDVRSENQGHPKVSSSRQQPIMSVKNKASGEIEDQVMQAKVFPNQEDQDCSVPNIRCQDDACLQQEYVDGSQYKEIDRGNDLSTRDMDNENALVPKGCFCATANQTSLLEASNDAEYHDTGSGSPIQKENLEESGDFSKVSIVKKISCLKVSPDDVVGIIGQKRFWKARREIANQQRVFAVQVFELHRLIKVQQLIAASPDILLEDGAFIGNFPRKGSTPKSLALEVVVEPQQQNHKRQNDSEKPNHKTECSAENAVGKKTSFSSRKNGSHLTNHTPFPGNPQQANETTDNRTSPWCFNQSPGHQWLIPVMSASEGLVYKPYPGPGFTGTMQGGPFGQVPFGATFMNPAYGIPASHQVPQFVPPGSHACFPPYGMPVMNQAASGSAVEQVNRFAAQGSHGQNAHASVEGANFNTHHNQSSSNLRIQRNETQKFQVSKGRELQGSPASSPSEMAQGIRERKLSEASVDAHSLFLQSLETRHQTQVIKVVPHNRNSATESAARIFRSIQEERKQYDLA